MQTALKIGTRVVDRDGFIGTIMSVTENRGSRWYDVRFERGEAVRYDSDLTVVAYPPSRPGDEAAVYAEETGCDYSEALVRCNMD